MRGRGGVEYDYMFLKTVKIEGKLPVKREKGRGDLMQREERNRSPTHLRGKIRLNQDDLI